MVTVLYQMTDGSVCHLMECSLTGGGQVSAVQEESRQRGAALHAVEQDTISMRQSAEQVRRTAEVVEQTMNVRFHHVECGACLLRSTMPGIRKWWPEPSHQSPIL